MFTLKKLDIPTGIPNHSEMSKKVEEFNEAITAYVNNSCQTEIYVAPFSEDGKTGIFFSLEDERSSHVTFEEMFENMHETYSGADDEFSRMIYELRNSFESAVRKAIAQYESAK